VEWFEDITEIFVLLQLYLDLSRKQSNSLDGRDLAYTCSRLNCTTFQLKRYSPTKLMKVKRAVLLLWLRGHYAAFAISRNITITGVFFAANEPVSVVAANPTAATFAGTRILTITFQGTSTTGTQVGTIRNLCYWPVYRRVH
jgi:hypothetical protein